jgi:hypothetical protein
VEFVGLVLGQELGQELRAAFDEETSHRTFR